MLYSVSSFTKKSYGPNSVGKNSFWPRPFSPLGGSQPYLNLFKPIPISVSPIMEAEGVIGLNRF